MRTIFHSDMNCFYASVEIARHPAWEGLPLAVCGSREDRHGIVLAKSDQAKACGIKTGETVAEAQSKCPGLLVVPPHYEWYEEYSHLARRIYLDYTDQVEPYGLDECWLELGEKDPRQAWLEAEKLRLRILRELGLRVSIGISYTKTYAKIGSDNAPRAGKIIVRPEDSREKIWPLAIRALPGVGPATERKLHGYNIRTIGQLATLDGSFCRTILGKPGVTLWNHARGVEPDPVKRREEMPPPISIGRGITCREDLQTERDVYRILLYLTQEVERALVREKAGAGGLTLHLRDAASLLDYSWSTRLKRPARGSHALLAAAMELYRAAPAFPEGIRAVTVRAEQLLKEPVPRQRSFFDTGLEEREEALEASLRGIRSRYGRQAVDYACFFGETKLPRGSAPICTLPGSRSLGSLAEEKACISSRNR